MDTLQDCFTPLSLDESIERQLWAFGGVLPPVRELSMRGSEADILVPLPMAEQRTPYKKPY